MKKILITGSLGQIGSELGTALKLRYGEENVIMTDIRNDPEESVIGGGRYYQLDCKNGEALDRIVREERVDTVYHLAAILSASAEKDPLASWSINIDGLLAVLEVARMRGCSVFTPSSIGAFGPGTQKDFTPQDTIQRPTSMYGITKVSGELLCDYYHHKYGVDTRGVRYPGIISHVTPPGGGTTDYAVEIFYEAVRKHRYTCFLKGDTYLDMIYMPDAVKAAIDVMEADPGKFRHRNAFNLTAMSFCPEDLAAFIRVHIPDFQITYDVDPVRQSIANSWPNILEDYAARVEWGWQPEYDMGRMTAEMLTVLKERYEGKEKEEVLS